MSEEFVSEMLEIARKARVGEHHPDPILEVWALSLEQTMSEMAAALLRYIREHPEVMEEFRRETRS